MTPENAQKFADGWIEAWNSHNLERILSHYDDDFEMSSPEIVKVAGEVSGRLRGKAAVGAYWAKALDELPNLHFVMKDILVGMDSIVLYYEGHRGPSAEWFEFGPEGKVIRAAGHYRFGAIG